MLSFIKHADEALLLKINSWHNPFFDKLMPRISDGVLWVPLVLWTIYALYKISGRKVIYTILFILALLTLSDQSCNLVKNTVKRYRPTHNLLIGEKVYIVNNYQGGTYGFISSHAANSFAAFIFLFLLLKPYKQQALIICLLLSTLLFCYSRMYLGVHYPLDIIGGALLGSCFGYVFYKLHHKIIA